MSSVISFLFFIAIFLLFSINKSYIQILVTLIVGLILDFTIVQGFSNTPLFGAITLSIGEPILQILIYTIIKMLVMGLYYLLLQKSNITALVGYLLINLLINKFYMTISGNIFIDIIFNSIIGAIIFITYNKSNYLDDLKWFSIIAVIIESVLSTLISSIFFT